MTDHNHCPMCGQLEPPRDPNRPDQVNEIVREMREIADAMRSANLIRSMQLGYLADKLHCQFVRQHRS